MLDAGISYVEYDGFLPSGAASLAPSIRWDHPRGRGFVSARGTYLRFESGNRSLDFSARGSFFMPLARRWRGELGAGVGASDYASIAHFSHGIVDARVHLMDQDRGGWFSTSVGRSSFGDGPRPVAVVAMGVWLLKNEASISASLDRSFVGDTAYSDLRSSARLQRGGIQLDGTLGARVFSNGAGHGVYGEASVLVPLGQGAAVIVAAGRYPTDVITGSIAGRYVSAGFRLGKLGFRPSRPAERPQAGIPPLSTGADGSVPPGETRLEVTNRGADEPVRLTLYAPDARAVEISGDFTDWQPVQLQRSATKRDAWEGAFRIAPGIHRINVRRDGGPWTAPAGTTRSADDFGGEVGVFLLP
ncbi:MAG TPA: hypothetical protein VN513_02155 [Gemmatimonadales bacterium]|nr:hypothetical protein [Gemmatimonadales bacterium]